MVTQHFFNGINRDSKELDIDASQGEYFDALNLVFQNQGVAPDSRRANMKGNTLISNTLPAGTNKCIGSYEDRENERMFFFNYNSNGDHAIYFLESRGDITKVIDVPFGFSATGSIDHVAVTADLLFWVGTDKVPYYLNVKRALKGTYGTLTQEKASFIKKPPLLKPTPSKSDDTSLPINKIFDRNFQFAYRFIYIDDEQSPLSPFSDWVTPYTVLDYDLTDADRIVDGNTIDIELDLSGENRDLLKAVQVLVREQTSETILNWRIIDTLKGSEISSTPSVAFNNFGTYLSIADSDVTKTFDLVPRQTTALSLINNRIFVTDNESGFSVDESDITLTVTPGTESIGTLGSSRFYFKKGGVYEVGVVYFDEFGRHSGVQKKTKFSIDPPQYDTSSGVLRLGDGDFITVAISGTPPVWAKYYTIVRTPNLFNGEYFQAPCNTLFYVRDAVDGDPASFSVTLGAVSFTAEKVNEKFYLDTASQTKYPNFTQGSGEIHLEMPIGIPFEPTTDTFVRLLNSDNGTAIGEIGRVKGTYDFGLKILEIDNLLGGIDWSVFQDGNTDGNASELFYEVFNLNRSSESDFLYDATKLYSVTDPGTESRVHATTSIKMYGDTYRHNTAVIPSQKVWYEYFYNSNFDSKFFTNEDVALKSNDTKNYSIFPEAPASVLPEFAGSSTKRTSVAFGLSNDYVGRVRPVIQNEQEGKFPTVIRYSEQFIQDSSINGLNSFLATNKETLPSERTPITAIVPVDDDVALVLHKRSVSSLYIAQGFVKFTDGNEFLAQAEGVVGDERKARNRYGTVNPESIAVFTGKVRSEAGTGTRVYFADANEETFCRYALNGITPIGDYFMQSYFATKFKDYRENNGKIYGGFDPYQRLYYATFAPLTKQVREVIATNTEFQASSPSATPETWESSTIQSGEKYRVTLQASNELNVIDVSGSYAGVGILSTTTITDEEFTFEFTAGSSGGDLIIARSLGSTTTLLITVEHIVSEESISGETWLFSEEKNRWIGRTSMVPERYGMLNRKMYAFNGGAIYEHGSNDTYCNFFGVQYGLELTFICNSLSELEKVWKSIRGDWDSDTIYMEIENEKGQQTTIKPSQMRDWDSLKYADIQRDINTPVAVYSQYGANATALTHGNVLRSKWLKVTLKQDSAASEVNINSVGVGYDKVLGHLKGRGKA